LEHTEFFRRTASETSRAKINRRGFHAYERLTIVTIVKRGAFKINSTKLAQFMSARQDFCQIHKFSMKLSLSIKFMTICAGIETKFLRMKRKFAQSSVQVIIN
jgi:hypothetical protein